MKNERLNWWKKFNEVQRDWYQRQETHNWDDPTTVTARFDEGLNSEIKVTSDFMA